MKLKLYESGEHTRPYVSPSAPSPMALRDDRQSCGWRGANRRTRGRVRSQDQRNLIPRKSLKPFPFALAGLFLYLNPTVQVRVRFYSYFKDLAGSSEITETVAVGSKLEILVQQVFDRFPKLSAMRKSALVAVGLDYQTGDYVLEEGDEVSLFPPVQGG